MSKIPKSGLKQIILMLKLHQLNDIKNIIKRLESKFILIYYINNYFSFLNEYQLIAFSSNSAGYLIDFLDLKRPQALKNVIKAISDQKIYEIENINTNKAAMSSMKQELDSTLRKIDAAQDKIREKEDELNDAESDIQKQKRLISELQEEMKKLEDEYKRIDEYRN